MFASPTGYMLTSSGFPLLDWGIFYKFLVKWSVIFLQSWNFNRLFLKLDRFICNYLPVLPEHCSTSLATNLLNSQKVSAESRWTKHTHWQTELLLLLLVCKDKVVSPFHLGVHVYWGYLWSDGATCVTETVVQRLRQELWLQVKLIITSPHIP